jgi:hypothetical protein
MRLSAFERYLRALEKQEALLDGCVEDERLMADMLLLRYQGQGRDVPEDIYRAVAFFLNEEFKRWPELKITLYELRGKIMKTIKIENKERAVDALCYRYQVYGRALLDNDKEIEQNGKN